jgi:hypothetical protein
MEEFVKNISSTSWWISVVLVGITINIFSSYLKPLLDSKIAKFSLSKKMANEKKEQEWMCLVEKIGIDKHVYMTQAFKDIRLRNKALINFIISILMFTLSQKIKENPILYAWPFLANIKTFLTVIDIATMFLATMSVTIGFKYYAEAQKITRALNESEKLNTITTD